MRARAVNILNVILWVASVSVLFSSCRHEAVLDQNLPEICFEREVLQTFRTNCWNTACHNGTGEGHYVFDNYFDIKKSVVPGKPEESPAYKAVIKSYGEGRMPPDQPLSLENRTIIRLWILQGANPTSCQDPSEQPPGYVNPRACFQRDILPSLVSFCASLKCHDVITHEEGYSFVSFSTTMMAVTPGNPGESKLYKVITAPVGEDDHMPPPDKPQLPAGVIDSIAAWIGYEAPDEYCGEICDTINPVTFSGTLWPVISTSCQGCHNAINPGGTIRLMNYSDVVAVASSGLLMNSLKGTGAIKMPLGGSLSPCRIRQFEMWITNQYPTK